MNCFLLVTILSETWFSLATLVVDPAVGVFDVIALDAEGGGIGVGGGSGGARWPTCRILNLLFCVEEYMHIIPLHCAETLDERRAVVDGFQL